MEVEEISERGRKFRRLDLEELLRTLGRRGITSLLVEGGGELEGSFLDRRLGDRLVLYVAPRILGGREARPWIGGEGVRTAAGAVGLSRVRSTRVGDGWLIEGSLGVQPSARQPTSPSALSPPDARSEPKYVYWVWCKLSGASSPPVFEATCVSSSSRATRIATELEIGASVAVSGVCLTATAIRAGSFHVEVARETERRTSLGSLAEGALVNLELPLRATDRLGGHIVQGHVDEVGRVAANPGRGREITC